MCQLTSLSERALQPIYLHTGAFLYVKIQIDIVLTSAGRLGAAKQHCIAVTTEYQRHLLPTTDTFSDTPTAIVFPVIAPYIRQLILPNHSFQLYYFNFPLSNSSRIHS